MEVTERRRKKKKEMKDKERKGTTPSKIAAALLHSQMKNISQCLPYFFRPLPFAYNDPKLLA